MSDFAQGLWDHPALWPLYLAGLWFLILRPLLRASRKPQAEVPPAQPAGAPLGDPAAQARYRELLERSFRAYRDGACDAYLKPAYVESVTNADPDELVANVLELHGANLHAAFASQPPRADEIYLGAFTGGSVVTNQRLFLLNADGLERTIEVISIKSYLESGILSKHVSIILKGGESIDRDGGIALPGPQMQALIESVNRLPQPAA